MKFPLICKIHEEDGVDGGGLRREFCSELLDSAEERLFDLLRFMEDEDNSEAEYTKEKLFMFGVFSGKHVVIGY